MQTGTMSIAEHRETARELLEESEREFAAGETLPSLEKMWGAVGHAVTAAAQRQGWPHGSHADLREAVRQLAAQSGDNGFLAGAFVLIEMLQANVHTGVSVGFLEPDGLESVRESVRLLIGRLLAFSDDAETG